MIFNWLDRIGDWNPQISREIKGRLNIRNLAIAVGSSLLGQLLLFFFWLNQLPREPYYQDNPYCRLQDAFLAVQKQKYALDSQYRQLQTQFKTYSGKDYNPEKIEQLKSRIEEIKAQIKPLQERLKDNLCPPNAIDLQLWWHDHYPKIFMSLSVFVMIIVLVVGTYMLISNLANEERRGTLNFIRLTPQSTFSILGGKLIGVPILLYLAAILTVPLQLWLGFQSGIALTEMLSFYAVLIAGCAFFFSAALLFGLVTPWLGGFQSWLGSGAVLIGLWMVNFKPIENNPLDWLNLFTPSVVLPYLIDRTGSDYYLGFPFSHSMIQDWTWYSLPIGKAGISLVLFVLINYALWTGWIWQALNRCFHNPTGTILNKRQSYWLVACFEVVALGLVSENSKGYYFGESSMTSPGLLAFFNLGLFLALIAVLSPHRQTLQDWARYHKRKAATRQGFWHRSSVQELIRGEKSPAIVAIAINLAIAITPFLVWIVFWSSSPISQIKAVAAVAFFVTWVMIYASIAQLMLFMKTNKRSIWAAGTIATLLIVLPLGLTIVNVSTVDNPNWWLLSTFPWVGIEYAPLSTIGLVLLGEWSMLVLLNLRLTRQLRRAGESETKAMLAGRPSVLK